MPGAYQSQHDAALAQVKAKGVAVAFTQPNAGASYDPTTGMTSGGAPASLAGSAVRVRGNPQRYLALSLLESNAPTLLFVPDTYGQLPSLDASIVWAGEVHNVKDVLPIAPDGVAIAAKVIVAR